MNKYSYKALEFDKIKNLLAGFARTEEGKLRCLNLEPDTDYSEIDFNLSKTDSAVTRIWKQSTPEFSNIKPIDSILSRLKLGGSLKSFELLQVASLLETTANVKHYGRISIDENEVDELSASFDELEPNTPIVKEIRRCIEDVDVIASDASSTLRDIRRKMDNTNERIHSVLNSMINGKYRTYLQDNVITMRNNRYCLLVKLENKANVKGMIHDQSATGSTLFVEPSEVVSLNNELKQLQIEEKGEIEVILSRLSQMVFEAIDEIKNDYKVLIDLDFIFAKGAFAKSYKGTRPVLNLEKVIELKNARHPLLDKNKVVPIDMSLGSDFDLLVITGPNTGGKTVSLKMTGLMILMSQSGLFIPADEGSKVAVFDNVYADIGDEQSIEQSLSTFSAHMVNIVRILGEATENSLCLFDELGAGTDPTEGAALAIAILDYLHKKEISAVATTHYSELKMYALTEKGVENAACEFNVETLSPTYRLLIGVPGKSNAFAISSKLGLSDEIIDMAKERLSNEQESFEDLVSSLENTKKELDRDRKKAEEYKHDIEMLKKTYEEMQNKLESRKERIIEEATEKADEILKKAKEEADDAIREINNSRTNVKSLEKQRTRLREKRNENQSNKNKFSKKVKQKSNVNPEDLRIGDAVKIISMNLKGTLSSLPDNRNKVFVQTGILRSQVKVDDIIKIDEDDLAANYKVSQKQSQLKAAKSYNVSYEVNLIGKTTDEASSILDKYLDDAYLAGLSNVRIVHGKGTGALRNMVHQKLKNKMFIKSFKLGEYGEGDSGVTIAQFK